MPFSREFDDDAFVAGTAFTRSGSSPALSASLASGALASSFFHDPVVDVSRQTINPLIKRGLLPVSAIRIDPDKLKLDLLPVLPLKVVGQSVPPGTPIPVGSTVNITMTRSELLKLDIIRDAHVGLRESTMAEAHLALVKDRPEVTRILTNAAKDDLSNDDRVALKQIFEANGTPIDDDDSSKDTAAAVKALQAIAIFGGGA
jgi:hypothetical protein